MAKITYAANDLGRLIHRSNYEYVFSRREVLQINVIDGNKHANNSIYGNIAEVIRQRKFLPDYGFSDEKFVEMGFKMGRRLSVADFRDGLEESQKAEISLKVYFDVPYFHMVFDFRRPDGELAGSLLTNDYFLKYDARSNLWKPLRCMPEFFPNAIRNV